VKIKYLVFSLCAAVFFIAAAYLDLTLRARSAYLEGEKYLALAREPSLKKRAVNQDEKKPFLTAKEFKEGESAAKYAYIWYRTAAESFSPPETRWTRQARRKAPDALALWNAELRGKGR
jgi:hypothetical protein